MLFVSVKLKEYPDGTKKYYVYKKPYLKIDNTALDNVNFENCDSNENEDDKKHSEYMNMIRSKNKIKDYCLSNDFDMFWTLTFASDREDDKKCFNRLSEWLKYMKKKFGLFDYIFIPERHKDGCIHFHGVTGGFGGEVVQASHKGRLIYHNGEQVYNCSNWRYGHSTITMIRDRYKTASYITKYITKDLSKKVVGKGKKKYWASRGLKLPVVKYLDYNPLSGCNPDWENDNIQIFNVYTV